MWTQRHSRGESEKEVQIFGKESAKLFTNTKVQIFGKESAKLFANTKVQILGKEKCKTHRQFQRY